MNRLKTATVLAELIDRLQQRGSWTGETHVQKATYLMTAGAGVDLAFDFVLYRYGPFSFDLRDELTNLRADGILELEPQPYPYGPRLHTTAQAEALKKRYPKTLEGLGPVLDWVMNGVDAKGVGELERLATALFVVKREHLTDSHAVAERVVALKPHVSGIQAESAAAEIEALLKTVPPVGAPSPSVNAVV